MRFKRLSVFCVAAGLALAFPAAAEAKFEKIATKDKFLQVTEGRAMTLMGIRVFVTSDGRIGGKAFGREVSGAWRWQDGYFCRDLYWGETDFGPNCQEVRVDGDKIRFASDRGSGRSAVLTLK